MDLSFLVPERFRPPGFFYGWYIAMAGTLNGFFVAGITITGITRPVERNADWTYYKTLDFALTTGWDEFEDLLAQ